jgi:probable poly-beta-1,6-N-acetyl-D-glucosamine export protein
MKTYVKSIDALRIFSILAVLIIHTTTRTIEATHANLIDFPFTLFLNQAARFAVPLFFIISGFLLEVNSEPKIKYWEYFKKRFGRVAVPYVFWSAVYYLFIYNQNHDNFFKVILTGNASYQLYFIPALCIFYLLFPFFHKFYKVLASKVGLLLLLILQVALLHQDYFVRDFRYPDPIRIVILGYFFFIVGMVAAKNREKIHLFIHKAKYILIPAMILMSYYVFAEGLRRYLSTGNFMAYYSQWRPSVLVYTLLVGLAFFHIFEKKGLQFSFVEKISKLSFFVFFVHVIILEKFWTLFGKNLFNVLSGNSLGKLIFDPVFFGAVVLGSFLLAYLFHKVPKLSKLTG